MPSVFGCLQSPEEYSLCPILRIFGVEKAATSMFFFPFRGQEASFVSFPKAAIFLHGHDFLLLYPMAKTIRRILRDPE